MSMRALVFLPLLGWLAACATVTSPVPLGTEPEALDAAVWEGTWRNDNGSLELTMTDAENGLARIAFEEDGARKILDLIVRRSGDWTIVNVTEEDFEESEGLEGESESDADSGPSYLWARVEMKDGAILVWDPDPAAFAELVGKGVLPGTVAEDDVVLGTLSPEHYDIITSGSHGVLMKWDEPLVLYRMRKR